MTDWSRGKYELTAAQLHPVAVQVIERVEPVNGLHLLDIACGTGNATLEAARRGARAVGLDAAPRLLEVAEQQAREEGLEVDWMRADMASLPFGEDSFDAVVSVFGVIFGDPDTLAGEIARVLAPSGRMTITSWTPDGLMERIGQLAARQVIEATGGTDPAPADQAGTTAPFSWGRPDDLREVFAAHGLMVNSDTRQLNVTAGSVEDLAEEWFAHQPILLQVGELVGDDRYRQLREEATALLEETGDRGSGDGVSWTLEYLITQGSPV